MWSGKFFCRVSRRGKVPCAIYRLRTGFLRLYPRMAPACLYSHLPAVCSSSTARCGIHAGVEGGVFEAKASQRGRKLDMINLGCMTYDVHTPNERLEISSVGPLYEILREILKNVQ